MKKDPHSFSCHICFRSVFLLSQVTEKGAGSRKDESTFQIRFCWRWFLYVVVCVLVNIGFVLAQDFGPFTNADVNFVSRNENTGESISGNFAGNVGKGGTSQPSAQAQEWIDDFETDAIKWVDAGGDCTYKLTLRQRETGEAMSGSRFEHLKIQTETEGSKIYFSYPIYPVEVRQNLLIQLSLNANRMGLQLMARVVLPYTRDPETGRALTFLVSGGTYSSVERWQQLRIDDILHQFQTNVARKQGIQLNLESAYIDRILLNVYSGPGLLDLKIDSLVISGVYPVDRQILLGTLQPQPQAKDASANIQDFPPVKSEVETPTEIQPVETYDLYSKTYSSEKGPENALDSTGNSESGVTDRQIQTPETTGKNPDIKLNQNILQVDGTPLFVRAIRSHGESLEYLASLGFNTIWLEAPPTRLMETEANLLNIWFICPPPTDVRNFSRNPSQAIDPEKLRGYGLNRVLAWDFGVAPTSRDISRTEENKPGDPVKYARKQTEFLKQIPSEQLPSRSVIGLPGKDLASFGTVYDIILLNRNPLNSTMNFVSYAYWFRTVMNLLPPHKSVFAVIPTQYDPLLREQWTQMSKQLDAANGFAPAEMIPEALPLEQLRLLTYNVVMTGARGLFFESTSRLDAQDRETIYRARSLELINKEMLILEQWLSQSEKYTTFPSNRDDVVGSLIATRYVRILFPMVITSDAQYACGAGADRQITFLVRGLPETYQCWQYTLNGLSPLVNQRMVGGVHVELDELPLVATIVMTQNTRIVKSISQRIAHFAPRLAELMKELAVMKLENWLQLHGANKLDPREEMYYQRAKVFLDGAEKAYYAHEYADAFVLAQRAMRPVAYLEHQVWLENCTLNSSPNFQPAKVSCRSLPLHREWQKLMSGKTPGENLLPGGNLDDVREMARSGWFHFRSLNFYKGVTTRADILEEAAHTGNAGLKLEVTSEKNARVPLMFDSPPVVIQSPGVKVGPVGTTYQVEVWVNIPTQIYNSVEGLKITDSNSGEVLAERLLKTDGWQKVVFQRIVKDENPVYITIAMAGYGTVYVDDVAIRPIQ